jgi:hypothetical protein
MQLVLSFLPHGGKYEILDKRKKAAEAERGYIRV